MKSEKLRGREGQTRTRIFRDGSVSSNDSSTVFDDTSPIRDKYTIVLEAGKN
jgi:hypothetical protein